MPSALTRLPGRLWAMPSFPYSLRVFIALTATMAACWLGGRMDWLMPLLLGAIACAIAETDDSWRGRLRMVGVTLACFAVAAFSVRALAPHPWLFGAGMLISTFAFVMLGAVGPRYQAIGYATLILSIYTAISMEQHALRGEAPEWIEPALLLAGAAWYGLLSVLWAAVFVHQPVQQALARLWRLLADYLRVKAALFEPVRGLDVERRRLSLAQINGGVVRELNLVKESLFARLRGVRSPRTARYLRLYFLAQDVHERASSSHYPYEELAEAFFHSDAMFRGQRVLRLSADDCDRLARAILLRQPFVQPPDTEAALADLDAAIEWLARQAPAEPARERLIDTLRALARNLASLDAQIAGASRPAPADGAAAQGADQSLLDRSPRSLREAADRVKLQFDPGAPLFRHAVRLTLALLAGYGLTRLFPTAQGYWILLTTLFVCQPGYGATRRRVVERVSGTFAGLAVGWAVFGLFPEPLVQAAFAVAAGVVFFSLRTTRYAVATGAMTLLVLLAANQIGDGYGLIVPRMIDTLAGSLIAGLAVFAILPDWQGRRMHESVAGALAANAAYLRALADQYAGGPRDDLPFRLARRDAHNADAALSAAVAGMLREPGFLQREGDSSLRLLVLSHTLLSYLSGLGAHRARLADGTTRERLLAAAGAIADALGAIAGRLGQGLPPPAGEGVAAETLDGDHDHDHDHVGVGSDIGIGIDDIEDLGATEADATGRLVATQLALLARQLPALRALAAALAPGPDAGPAAARPAAARGT